MFKSIISLFLAVALFGCNDDQLDVVTPTIENYNFNMKLPVDGSAGESTETIADVNSYTVYNNIFIESFLNIPLVGTKFSIDAPQNSQLYFTSNITQPTSLAGLEPNKTSLTTLLAATTDATMTHPDNKAPNFFTGSYGTTGNLVEESSSNVIKMMRSTARLDVNISNDQISVSKIVVKNASKTTYVFKQAKKLEATDKIGYEKTYIPELTGVTEDLFRLYESANVEITISATYHGVSMQTKVIVQQVERNNKYIIKITNEGTTIDGSFSVIPWENTIEIPGMITPVR